jgi:hypothetical protein
MSKLSNPSIESKLEISPLFPRIIPRGREAEFPLFHAPYSRAWKWKIPGMKEHEPENLTITPN